MSPQMIVAEISKSWLWGEEPKPPTVAQQFELVIDTNHNRGYWLHSWKFNSVIDTAHNTLTETIVAVFQRKEDWEMEES